MKSSARDGSGEIVAIRLPDPATVFARRARRFAEVAEGNAAGPFLSFLAVIARAQDTAVRVLPPASAPDGPRLAPADVTGSPAFTQWRAALRIVLEGARGAALPEPARVTVARLETAGGPELEALAHDVLAGAPTDLAAAPFVGAALQVLFTRLAAGLDARALAGGGGPGCPVCGSGPVAGLLLGVERLRYLVCARCTTEWHLPRVHCASCQATDSIGSLSIEGGTPARPAPVRAETCDACHHYVKLLDQEQLPGAEATADDAATIVLDLLVAERGYRRAGPNLLAPVGEPA